MTTQPQPTARPAKPRLLQDGRDMFWSIAPLVVACIVLAGMVGMCTFAPDGTNRGQVPSYDAASALRADAQTLGFPVRLPRLPEGWQPNSGSRGSVPDGRTDPSTGQRLRAVISTVGYISPSGMYLGLTQSNADEDKLVGSIHPSMYPTGTDDVDGTRWIVYQGDGVEPVWTTRLSSPVGPAQVAVTGAGGVDQFRTLAAATQSQPPLPAHR
ncbi:DUF4245 domain-containing protein [Mycobacterium sp.]|uniref:DUF4245 domain-containing protein n=1 Tax=Mycobacterium sp. TaxID=1785 RepID=UPI003C746833